jgi:molecular chaperone DnaK
MGAAVQAETLTGGKIVLSGSSEQVILMDVTPLTLAIETVGAVSTPLVPRNTTIPTRYSKVFTTAAPFQTSVDIHVLQGERPMARDNKTIGRFRLSGIKPAPAGVPQIEVSFDIDASGILKVSAKDLASGREQSIVITENGKMSDAEIERAMADAVKYASMDGIRKEFIALRNEANSLLAKTEQALASMGKTLDKAEKKQVKSDCSALRKSLNRVKVNDLREEDLAQVRAAKETLEQSAAHLISLS